MSASALALQDELLSAADLNEVVLKPLVCLQTAAAMLGPSFSEQHVLRDIKRGPRDPRRIEWAWDIAGADTRTRGGKADVMILATCVPLIRRVQRKSFREVLAEIFPENAHTPSTQNFTTVKSRDLARRFGCTIMHILQLIEDRSLEALPHTRHVLGRNGAPAITWPSITRFLTERRFQ